MRRNRVSYSVEAEISAYYNDPDSGGYQTRGTPLEELGKVNGEGFIASFHRDSGYAILYRRVLAGGRMTQFNMALSWKGFLPLCYLEKVKSFLSRQKPEDCGDIHPVFGEEEKGVFPGEFPVADPALISDILEVCKKDSCLVVDKACIPDAEKLVVDALARLIIPEDGITVGLPLPANTPLCTVNVFPDEEAFCPGETSKPVLNHDYPLERNLDEEPSMSRDASNLSDTIATAESSVVNLAIMKNNMRVYHLYDSLRIGRSLPQKEGDMALLTDLLSMMAETSKEQYLTKYLFKSGERRVHEEKNSCDTPKKKKVKTILMLVLFLAILAVIVFFAYKLMNGGVRISIVIGDRAAVIFAVTAVLIALTMVRVARRLMS